MSVYLDNAQDEKQKPCSGAGFFWLTNKSILSKIDGRVQDIINLVSDPG